jgi:hypothetical protein
MFINYVFNASAFKHGVAEIDIRAASSFPLFDGFIEGYDNKYLPTGFDSAHQTPEEIIGALIRKELADAL